MLIKTYQATRFSLLMLLASLIIASAGLSAVLLLNESAKQSYAAQQDALVPGASHQIVAKNTQKPIQKSDYAQLRQQGINLVAVARVSAHIYHNDKQLTQRSVDIIGVDTLALIGLLPQVSQQTNEHNETGDMLSNAGLNNSIAFAHSELLNAMASQSELTASDWSNAVLKPSFNLGQQSYTENKALPELLAWDNPGLGNDIVMDINSLYGLYTQAHISAMYWIQDPFQLSTNAFQELLPKHLSLSALQEVDNSEQRTKSFHVNLLAMALLMFVVCMFIVLNAVNLLLNKRMPWLRICRQLGIPRRSLFLVQLLEIITLTLLANAIGLWLGLQLASIVSPTVQATLESLYNVQVGYGESAIFMLFLQVFAICLLGCTMAFVLPYRNIEQQLALSKHPQNSHHTIFHKMLWAAGLLLSCFAYFLLSHASELWILLVGAASMILAGCCFLMASYPYMLNSLFIAIPTRFSLLRVSTKQSVALSNKSKIACCAFFIAATSNIGMNLMVDSFRGATQEWLQSRLNADYYFFYEGEKDLTPLAQNAGLTLIPRYEYEGKFDSQPIQQFSYPSTPQFIEAMVFYKVDNNAQAWQEFTNGKGVFVNQQFAFTFNLDIGANITLQHPAKQTQDSYHIAGIYYDFGSPHKQVLMPLSVFEQANAQVSIFALLASPSQLQTFKTLLTNNNIAFDQSLISTGDLLQVSMQAFDRTFVITDGLNIVTLLVAALSLACAIVVLMNDVLPQNMLIRSLGVSAVKTQALAFFQYLILCLVALILATPFGILLSYVLIYSINYYAFQWTYPLHVDAMKIMWVYIVSLSIVTIVIAFPLVQAGRRPLIKDIRCLS